MKTEKIVTEILKKADKVDEVWKHEYLPRIKNNINPKIPKWLDEFETYTRKLKKELDPKNYNISRYGLTSLDIKKLDKKLEDFTEKLWGDFEDTFQKLTK